MAGMEARPSNALPAFVYAILISLAFAVGLIALGNQAGWWRIDF